MKIYVGHSKNIDYLNDLYKPIMDSDVYNNGNYDFIFPHLDNFDLKNDRQFYDSIDLFLAEVSTPAIGLGIELGYAHDSDIPIVLLLKKGVKCNGSSRNIAQSVLEYESNEQLVSLIEKYLTEK